MTTYRVLKTFAWAEKGIHVKEHPAGMEFESNDQEMIDVALHEKWIEPVAPEKPKVAPRKKAHTTTRRNK